MEIMMFKKYVILSLGTIAFGSPSTMMPMAGKITPVLAKEYLKKGVEKSTNFMNWAIATLPVWAMGTAKLYTTTAHIERIKNKEEAEKEIFRKDQVDKIWNDKEKKEAWIRNELKELGYQEWESLVLADSSSGRFGVASNFKSKILTYDFDEVSQAYEQYNSWLNKHDKFSDLAKCDKLNEIRGTLSHEKTHLEKMHPEKMILLAFSIPVATHLLGKKIFGPQNSSWLNSHFVLKNSLKLVTGINKLVINLTALWAAVYFAEKEADEGVVDDVAILEAMAKEMREDGTDLEKRIQNDEELRFRYLVDRHPSPFKRAARFEARAAQLKKQQL